MQGTKLTGNQNNIKDNHEVESLLNLVDIIKASNVENQIMEKEQQLHDKDRMYTRAVRDIFHEFHNLKLPKNGPATIQIHHLVIVATCINNDEDYDAVVDTLLDKGVEDIAKHEFLINNIGDNM